MDIESFDMILHSQYSGVQLNNVKDITLTDHSEETSFPYWFLKNVPNLKRIIVDSCSLREIFQGEQLINTEKETQIIPQLRVLKLRDMGELQCICKEGFQMDPVLHFLESISVRNCPSLLKLVPSSILPLIT
jgi:hypothetical protein